MNIKNYKRQLLCIPHIIFWFVSFNFWYIILNPGVESASVVQDFEVNLDFVLLINSILLLYCALPFIWLAKKLKLWLKLIPSILFLAPVGYVVFQAFHPEGMKDEVRVVLGYIVKNFLYVLVFHLTIVAAVYINMKVLLVRYLSKSRFGKYIVLVVGLLFGGALVNYCLFNFVIDKIFPSLYYISYFKIWELIVIFKFYLLVSILVFLFIQYIEMLIMRRDAARNELSALKAQINPHFLFNNLNTIYSMAAQKDDRTADVVLKLSDFLRYVLYDTSCETISLEKEVGIIQTYIGLQQERLNREATQIDFTTEGDFGKSEIAPLLMLPLAENCFKHGTGMNTGTIRISVRFDGKQLIFKTINRIAPREAEKGGIGLKNVEKRLSLIYPERHSLEYSEEEGVFKLEMKIELI